MRGVRIAAGVAVAMVVALLCVYGTMRAGWWNTDFETAKARQAAPPSKFVTIDGVPIHYRDAGSGPVLVLLHGSIVNLHEWDLVVERLKGRYRLVRLDWPPYGLSGPEPKGVYTTPRAAELVRVPVLLQWCGYDTVISQGLERTKKRFTQAPVTVVEYPDVGHFPMWQIADRFSDDLARWIDALQARPPTQAGG